MMRMLLGLWLGLLATVAYGQTCTGPTCQQSSDSTVVAPFELCVGPACYPVAYLRQEWPMTTTGPGTAPWFVLAFSRVLGYPIVGVGGPCMGEWQCPALYDVAFEDLRIRAWHASRVLRYADDYR